MCGAMNNCPAMQHRCLVHAALSHEVAAGLKASGLGAQVVSAFRNHLISRQPAVILRRVEASLIDGPDIALIAIARLPCIRHAIQWFENPVAIGPSPHSARRLHGSHSVCAPWRLCGAHRQRCGRCILPHYD